MNRLPDPDLLRDALFLVDNPGWTPRDLDGADAQLLNLIRGLKKPVKKG